VNITSLIYKKKYKISIRDPSKQLKTTLLQEIEQESIPLFVVAIVVIAVDVVSAVAVVVVFAAVVVVVFAAVVVDSEQIFTTLIVFQGLSGSWTLTLHRNRRRSPTADVRRPMPFPGV